MDSTLIQQKELESLKEVSEDSFTSQSDNNDSVFIKSNSKQEKIKEENKYQLKNKNKIHCLLKIYKGEELILSLDFYDNILLPNLTFKGIPIPIEQKGKKDTSVDDLNIFAKMTQYKIHCYLEGNDIPSYLQNENLIDWKIQVFSTDTIGFVKDTTKEDNERSLINSWEVKEAGRSQKAEHARIKFVEDRKFQVDTYIQEIEKGNKY